MESGGSLTRPPELANGPCSDPDDSKQSPPILVHLPFIIIIIIVIEI